MSLFGDLKYPPGLPAFRLRESGRAEGRAARDVGADLDFNQNPQTFNTLNGYVTRGDAAPRPELTFDGLMGGAADEPNSLYGLVAEAVDIDEATREVPLLPAR